QSWAFGGRAGNLVNCGLVRQSNFRPTSGQCLGGARTLERRGSPRHGAGFFSIPLIRRKETVLALPSRRGGEVKPGEPGGWRRLMSIGTSRGRRRLAGQQSAQ